MSNKFGESPALISKGKKKIVACYCIHDYFVCRYAASSDSTGPKKNSFRATATLSHFEKCAFGILSLARIPIDHISPPMIFVFLFPPADWLVCVWYVSLPYLISLSACSPAYIPRFFFAPYALMLFRSLNTTYVLVMAQATAALEDASPLLATRKTKTAPPTYTRI